MKLSVLVSLMCVMLLDVALSFALDNPDSPQYLVQFEKKSQQYEQDINELYKNLDIIKAYRAYEMYLDGQLNEAYGLLKLKLNSEQQAQLKISQLAWIQFRDQEFKFIEANWTKEQFGSSYTMSIGAYKTKIIKNRTEILYRYLQNYL